MKKSSEIKTFNSAGSYTFGTSDTKTGEFTLTASNQSSKVAYIDNIAMTFKNSSLSVLFS